MKEEEDLKVYKDVLPKLGKDSHLTCIEKRWLTPIGTLGASDSQGSHSAVVTSSHFDVKLSL